MATTGLNISTITSNNASSLVDDATMRNALEFLTQRDSESALIYALVHDPEFRLASALVVNRKSINTNVICALLQVFDAYEDQLRRFIGLLMLREMIDTMNWNELFRANSATTAIIREYTCDLGTEFLQNIFQDVLSDIWDVTESCEVNPMYLSPEDDLAANQARLLALATRLLDRVFESVSLFPYQVAKIYRVMELEMTRLIERDRKSNGSIPRLSSISEDLTRLDGSTERKSSASFPRLSAISEVLLGSSMDDDLGVPSYNTRASYASSSSGSASTTANSAKEEFYVHLGGFLFLRFLCPALIMPHKMDLTPNGASPSKTLQRTLVLVAKLWQSLANNVEYGSREAYMEPFNVFLKENRTRLVKFYDQIGQQAQNDNRRESLILRSNMTPRISQLWTTATATTGEGRVGSTASLVHSVEGALVVLQRWMRENVDVLVREVAAAASSKAKRKSPVRASEDTGVAASSLPSGAISPVKKQKRSPRRPRHKLKTSTSMSPVPTIATVERENDNDDEEQDAPNEETCTLIQPSTLTPDELELVMGRTSHRDIRVMQIYYSNLSQSGLQRLLDVQHDASENWTLYKSRSGIDVFKRTSTGPPAACLGNSAGSSSQKWVEMKAHVVIHATPRQVFKYLRSLETMSEWDDHVARKVEPLDDTRVVLYRSHPKLSLWPTWLVKPRDSCDLHSFVEKTGRPDTYAVLMESVPRPDVPQVKGTVRMSYATGGFLVEPAATEGGGGSQSTLLTCVIRADFKGHLPRYLAESVCFRQVLSVRTIKLRLEANLQHSNSSWV